MRRIKIQTPPWTYYNYIKISNTIDCCQGLKKKKKKNSNYNLLLKLKKKIKCYFNNLSFFFLNNRSLIVNRSALCDLV